MNDFERQLQAMQLAAPSETLDRRMDTAFSDAEALSEGGARCPPLDRPFRQAQGPEPVEEPGALSLPNGQRASELQPEFSNQRVEVNALHLRSPESDRAKASVSTQTPRRRVALVVLLTGLGAAAAVAGLILLPFHPMPHQIDASPNVVAYHLEATGLMRQFLSETPISQRPLPKFTVGVGSPALPPSTVKSNPAS
jgi:hypothetical protein